MEMYLSQREACKQQPMHDESNESDRFSAAEAALGGDLNKRLA